MTTPSPKDWPEPAVGESAYFGYDPTPISALMEEMDDELGLSPGKMEMAIALGLSALQVPN
jgi:hypothetical protein